MIHYELLTEHGGTPEVRERGDDLIDSALMRPKTLQEYEPDSGLSDLAAAYLLGLAKHPGYLDGNKRVAFATAATFLLLNGLHLAAPEVEAYDAVLGVADGRYSQKWVAKWLRRNSVETE